MSTKSDGPTLTRLGVLGAVVCTFGAMLAGAYFAAPGPEGSPLALNVDVMVGRTPFLFIVLVGVVACWSAKAGSWPAYWLLTAGVWTVATSVSAVGYWSDLAWLALASGVLLTLGSLLLLGSRGRAVRVDTQALPWAVAATLLAVLWIVGEWLPWDRTVTTFTPVGATRPQSVHEDCCVAFTQGTWDGIQQGLLMVAILALALVAALLWPRRSSGMSLIAIGLIYLQEIAVFLQGLSAPDPSSADLAEKYEVSVSHIRQLSGSEHLMGLPGAWIATGAVVALCLLGLFRLLSTVAHEQ